MLLQLVDEGEAIITNSNRSVDDFGRLLHESWKIKRTLTQKITNPRIDEIYEAGLSAGALGGKLLGAGGGGFMLFYVPPDKRQALRARLQNLLCVPFSFSNRGSHVVVYEPEEAFDQSVVNERFTVYAQHADNNGTENHGQETVFQDSSVGSSRIAASSESPFVDIEKATA
jgi:hypothetical protein